MKTILRDRRGIVMMEFIIVFPIYLVLFAAIMAVGDMLVHSIRLPSAERTAALDVGKSLSAGWGWDRVTDTLFSPREIADDGGQQDQLAKERELDHSDDTQIEGPWAMTAGEKVRDDYKLPVGGSAGQLAFCDWYFSDVTKTAQAGGPFGNLIGGGAVPMYSKEVGATLYNYYTLKRRRNFDAVGSQNQSWRYNGRHPSNLVVYDGWRKVRYEEYETGSGRESNSGALQGNPPLYPKENYKRDYRFEQWSN